MKSDGRLTHGKTRRGNRHPAYNIWMGIRRRCHTPGLVAYELYGGRGITVCDEWRGSFETFLQWCLSNGYAKGLQIDRRDNNKGYGPDNCRFVTSKVNNNNKRNNVVIEAFGESKTATQWCDDDRCSVSDSTIISRLRDGMQPEMAITMPRQPPRKSRLDKKYVPMIREMWRRNPGSSGVQSFMSRWFGIAKPHITNICNGKARINE